MAAAVQLGTAGGLTEAWAAYLEGTQGKAQAAAAAGEAALHMFDQDTAPNMPEAQEEVEGELQEHNSLGAVVDMTRDMEPERILDGHIAAAVVADQLDTAHTE